MARKKSNDKSGKAILLFFVAFFLFLVATALMAAWLVLTWLYREIRYCRVPRKLTSIPDLTYTDEEVRKLISLKVDQYHLRRQRDSSLEKGASLQRRKDGYFHERTQLGKDLNRHLRMLVKDGRNAEYSISRIESAPSTRLNDWIHKRSLLSRHRISVVCLIVLLSVFYYFEPSWVVSFGAFILDFLSRMLGATSTSDEEIQLIYGSVVIATWSAFGIFHAWRLATNSWRDKLSIAHARILGELDGEIGDAALEEFRNDFDAR